MERRVPACSFSLSECSIEALGTAGAGEEVWVAAGRYVPDGVDSTATFLIPSGVSVRGGFGGLEANPGERDWRSNASILDGDRLGDDLQDPNAHSQDNSQHVVTVESAGSGTLLDGFFVSGGRGWWPAGGGGGLRIDASAIDVRNCVFEGNVADSGYDSFRHELDGSAGGAILSVNGSQVRIEDSEFRENAGGALMSVDSSLSVSRCAFIGNLAEAGGAIAVRGGTAFVRNTELSANESEHEGGAIFAQDTVLHLSGSDLRENTTTVGIALGGAIAMRWLGSLDDSALVVTGSSFARNSAGCGGAISLARAPSSTGTAMIWGSAFIGNQASGTTSECGGGQGGAVYFARIPGAWAEGTAQLTLGNSYFSGNSASRGGAIHASEAHAVLVSNSSFASNVPNAIRVIGWASGTLDVTNSVLWANGTDPLLAEVNASVSYSCVEGGWTGPSSGGNVATDPGFVDADGADDVAGTEDDDLRLVHASPAVDAGSNDLVLPDLLDLDGDGDVSEPVPFDVDGNTRFADVPVSDTGQGTPPVVDMGAYEAAL